MSPGQGFAGERAVGVHPPQGDETYDGLDIDKLGT